MSRGAPRADAGRDGKCSRNAQSDRRLIRALHRNARRLATLRRRARTGACGQVAPMCRRRAQVRALTFGHETRSRRVFPDRRSRLLDEHLGACTKLSPPASVHALDFSAAANATWTFGPRGRGLCCAGGERSRKKKNKKKKKHTKKTKKKKIKKKRWTRPHGEIKSLTTDERAPAQGAVDVILPTIIGVDRIADTRDSASDGVDGGFLPRTSYESFGSLTAAFADSRIDPTAFFRPCAWNACTTATVRLVMARAKTGSSRGFRGTTRSPYPVHRRAVH